MAELTVHQLPTGADFVYNYSVADAQGAEDIIAAVAGATHYIRKVSIVCTSDATVTIGSGQTGTAVTTALIGPTPFDAAGTGQVLFDFGRLGIKCTEGEAVTIDASAAGVISVIIEGRTCRV